MTPWPPKKESTPPPLHRGRKTGTSLPHQNSATQKEYPAKRLKRYLFCRSCPLCGSATFGFCGFGGFGFGWLSFYCRLSLFLAVDICLQCSTGNAWLSSCSFDGVLSVIPCHFFFMDVVCSKILGHLCFWASTASFANGWWWKSFDFMTSWNTGCSIRGTMSNHHVNVKKKQPRQTKTSHKKKKTTGVDAMCAEVAQAI